MVTSPGLSSFLGHIIVGVSRHVSKDLRVVLPSVISYTPFGGFGSVFLLELEQEQNKVLFFSISISSGDCFDRRFSVKGLKPLHVSPLLTKISVEHGVFLALLLQGDKLSFIPMIVVIPKVMKFWT